MKTVRSFANEEEEAAVYGRKLQQVYRLNRKEAAAYTSYVWGSGVRAGVQQSAETADRAWPPAAPVPWEVGWLGSS